MPVAVLMLVNENTAVSTTGIRKNRMTMIDRRRDHQQPERARAVEELDRIAVAAPGVADAMPSVEYRHGSAIRRPARLLPPACDR